MQNLFYPNGALAAQNNLQVHQALLKSLMHINEQLALEKKGSNQSLANIVSALTTGKQCAPETFGWYYQAVFSFLNNEDNEGNHALEMLSKQGFLSASEGINIFGYQEVSADNRTMLHHCLGETDGFCLSEVTSLELDAYKEQYQKAIPIIKATIPNFWLEFQLLVKKIVISKPGTGSALFYGMSPFQLWRALIVNVETAKTLPIMLETLIHETSHITLFGLSHFTPLTKNSGKDVCYSSIRNSKRPMDGIFHACFVTARVLYGMRKILRAQVLTEKENKEVAAILNKNYKHFQSSYETLKNNAKLTELGAKLLWETNEAVTALIPARIANAPLSAS